MSADASPVRMTRRRAITVMAATAGLALLPRTGRAAPQPVSWKGQLMGAEAGITLYHEDPDIARALIVDCVAEIDRLEDVFSLFRPHSALRRLNRDGALDSPPADLVAVLEEAGRIAALTDGAFDVTVQPLWDLYAAHFAHGRDDAIGPSAEAIAKACALVDWRNIDHTPDRVWFAHPGMAVTLNGIARGYVTDRVGALLRARGLEHVLLDLDNVLSLGPRPDGRPWRVGVADPRTPERLLAVLDTRDEAVSSSGGYGTRFDRLGKFHHIFDPATGRSAFSWAGTTVTAPSATVADALSTALIVLPHDRIAAVLRGAGATRAHLADADGTLTVIEA
ncbi:FAD:protein FMN transferase [Azospirillum canadense]|uniref:FAD:protein FMN transferase n=1 Tax=Azospirillum canadense TaxID=403962 RepID=UPI002227F649|nr:FAD:protein FMN transferase [Azospirillum canadense]MCW2243264.1 thiamine biosynthesis lipoprotein [Azospirillum canadense]